MSHSFDYKYTCPIIDKEIDRSKDIIREEIQELISSISPFVTGDSLYDLVSEYTEQLYKRLEPCFETTRSSNEGMRTEADNQISSLGEELDSLQEDTNIRIQSLEDEIQSLNDRIQELENNQ